jgi:phosphatidylglycerophosphate synthase
VRSPPYLPNLLSSLRITLAPAMLGAAYSNSKTGFLFLLVVAVLTDSIDGFLARRWRAETAMGRRLDHCGDALMMSLGALGVFFLWPESVEREWPWVLIALTGYLAIGVDRLWRRPGQVRHPSWWERILALIPPLSLVPLITDWSPWPFRAAAVLQVLVSLMCFGKRSVTLPTTRAGRQWSPKERRSSQVQS